VSAARKSGTGDVRLMINRVIPANFNRFHTTFDDVIDTVGARLIGVVRDDASVLRSLQMSIPLVLYKKRRAAYDFLDVARRIAGEDVPLRIR